ncbi:MAG: 3-hydroxyacyl-CoA dehydrogenase/enoyl-CoA hydratase family protein, partial [Deltaproteobacteria bacterium]|nr:3-hydroxyacyl-CoA dehydrogenase/enoyl-CoA hydratase family protein [Deltaproteobacteria bacterium]
MTRRVFREIGVLGSGVMGMGIAAHCANAGLKVLLLDIVPQGVAQGAPKAERNRIAAESLKRALQAKPASFFHPSHARLIEVGNFEDDLERLKRCDLVIEAVVERLDIKRALFERVERVIGPETIVASNTSGLRIRDMVNGRSEAFRKRFLVMHFFNPVRYMKLLEVVPGADTDQSVLEAVIQFGREVLGKGIVVGKDTPNFIGNRIGVYGMMVTIEEMLRAGLTPEDIDALTGPAMGHPKSATFRTADLVGIDTFAHVARNCYEALVDDEEREVFRLPSFIEGMVERKLLGEKTKGGFYRKNEKTGEIETLNFTTFEYRPKGGDESIAKLSKSIGKIEDVGERLRKLICAEGKGGEVAWRILARTLLYASKRVGEIADDILSIDNAMKWGYNWELGPFEAWDALGFEATIERMEKEGMLLPSWIRRMREKGAPSFYRDGEMWSFREERYVPMPRDRRELTVALARKAGGHKKPLLANGGAEAWDFGDGILGLTFKTKANSIDAEVIEMLEQSVELAEREFRGMVIANEGEHFCVGANLFAIVVAANQGQWEELRRTVKRLQNAVQRMKYAKVPIVAAPFGMTLGGGLEICLGATAVQAAAETYAGLVEVGVGLLPGGGGNLNLLWRALESIPEGQHVNVYEVVTQVFKNIALARVATSAVEAQAFGYFRRSDGVSFDRGRLIYEAKMRAIGLAESGYHPPVPRAYVLPGEHGIATLQMLVRTLVQAGQATEHDAKIAMKIAHVLCGGVAGHTHEVTEEEMLDLECEAFL